MSASTASTTSARDEQTLALLPLALGLAHLGRLRLRRGPVLFVLRHE